MKSQWQLVSQWQPIYHISYIKYNLSLIHWSSSWQFQWHYKIYMTIKSSTNQMICIFLLFSPSFWGSKKGRPAVSETHHVSLQIGISRDGQLIFCHQDLVFQLGHPQWALKLLTSPRLWNWEKAHVFYKSIYPPMSSNMAGRWESPRTEWRFQWENHRTKWRCSFVFDCQSVDLRCFTSSLPSDPRVLEKLGRPEFIRAISASNGACGAFGTLDQTTSFP